MALEFKFNIFTGTFGVVDIPDRLNGEFWVAKNGDDTSGDGSHGRPFLTIQKAYDTSTSDAIVKIMPGDYTENLVFDGNASTRVLLTGIGIEDQHRVKLIGFHTYVNQATRISFEDIQVADNGIQGNIFDFTDSDGRHYFKNVTFNLTNAASRPFVTGNNTANWHIFHDSTMAQEGDTSIGSVTGTPLFYFQECTGTYGVIQDNSVSVTALGCVVAPYVTHITGLLTIYNADTCNRDSSGRFVHSTAISAAGNRVALTNTNTWSNATDDFGIINIPTCDWIFTNVNRDRTQDTITEGNRLAKGITGVDIEMHLRDDQILSFGSSNDATMLYDSTDDDLVINPPTNGNLRVDGYTMFGGVNPPYMAGRGLLEVSALIDDIPGVDPSINGALLSPTFEWIAPITSAFAITTGVSLTLVGKPASSLGAGTDIHIVRGLLGNSTYTANGTGRTIATVSGAQFQAAVQTDGTATEALGLFAQAGTILGGTITTAISMDARQPFTFLGGTITTGISLRVIGGTSAGTNWALQVTGVNISSYFQGKTSFGHINVPIYIMDTTFMRVRGTGYIRFGGTTIAASTQISAGDNDGIFVLASVVAAGNNENLRIDLETTDNVVALDSTTGAGLALNFTNIGIYNTTPVAQAADPVALTDSTGGTANNTVVAIAGSGADATINDNFADLTAKYNSIRTILQNIGITA